MTRFRASRPANESQRDNAVDWGVYDAESGRLVTESHYAEAFARVLAGAMNWAYQQGAWKR